jgi:chromosome segregation ATPase
LNDIEGLRQQIALLETQKSEFGLERQGWTEAIRQAREDAERGVANRLEERSSLLEKLETKEQEITRLNILSVSATTQMDAIRREHAALRVELSTAGVAAARETEDLRKGLQDALATVAGLTAENERLAKELTERTASLNLATAKLDHFESRDQGGLADMRLQLRRTEAELNSVLALVPDLRTELTRSLEDVADLQKQLSASQERAAEIEEDRAHRLKSLESAARQIQALREDQAAKQALIDRLSGNLAAIEIDHADRLGVIESSARLIREIEADRTAKQAVIDRLSASIHEIEADRAARLTVIESSARHLQELEADRNAKQEVIDRLSSELSVVEADRAERGRQIETLNQMVRELEGETARLRSSVFPRFTKLARRA